MKCAQDVINADLDAICANAGAELEQLSGTSVLLTGGAGFLGYYIVQAVARWNEQSRGVRPIRLTVMDNYFRGVPQWIERFSSDDAISLVRHDMSAPLPETAERFPWIIHAAGIASPKYYRMHPIETMDANIYGLRSLLDYFAELKQDGIEPQGLLYFSSSEIYGDPAAEWIPTPEHYRGYVSCTGPRACYDESKRFGETLCVNFARQFDLPIHIARPFNNYGPGLKITDGRVIPDFARSIFAGQDIVLRSDGSPTRTFCYAADAVTGYFKALVNGRKGESYNIGTPEPEISMRSLAEEMVSLGAELAGYSGAVVHRVSDEAEYLTDNPARRCPDISKAAAQLGYSPAVGMSEGLRRTLLWYREHREATEA